MQIWKKWVPAENMSDSIIAKNLIVSGERATLTFEDSDGSRQINICFNEFLSLRETDEFSYEKSFADFALYLKKSKDAGLKSWFLYTIENSKFIQSFQEERLGLYNQATIQHYVIISNDIVSEILSILPPKVEFLNARQYGNMEKLGRFKKRCIQFFS